MDSDSIYDMASSTYENLNISDSTLCSDFDAYGYSLDDSAILSDFDTYSYSYQKLKIPTVDSTICSDSNACYDVITHVIAQFYKRLSIEFDEQRNQLHRFIMSQNEKMKIVVEQEVTNLATTLKSNVSYVAEREKNEIISCATKKMMAMEEHSSKLVIENELWRTAAQENEAMVLSLHNTIEQERVAAIDVESHCDQNVGNIEVKEEKENRVKDCKGCHSQNASFMPLSNGHHCS